MIIVRPEHPFPDALRGGVVAIGNFDGVHRGHQVLFELARRRAADLSAPLIILTFNPHPRAFFRPETPPFLITPPDLKMERLATTLADATVILHFDTRLATQTPVQFIDTILHDQLGATHVFVGRDFHFGHDRAGTVETIREYGIPVTTIDLMTDHTGNPYSSTRIRAQLQDGHIEDANRLLGWPWEMGGIVIHGDKRGRDLGFPTANITLTGSLVPAHGIYAAAVQIPNDGIWHPSAISLGHRPMFAVEDTLLEVHILGFTGDLYEQPLRVRPARRLRDEMRFDGIPALIAQMQADCNAARMILENHPVMS